MKKNTSKQKPLTTFNLLFVFSLILTIFICFLILGLRTFSPDVYTQTANQLSTITPIPLPDTIEKIEAGCSKGECLNACLNHANNQIQVSKLNSYEYFGDEKILVYYGVSDKDELEKPRKFKIPTELLSYQQDESAHKMIWDYYKSLIPRENRPNLVTFGIYISSTTLGNFDTTLTENWITNINIFALEDAPTLSMVVIHEYGHYLTLNTTQVSKEPLWGSCKVRLYRGCQLPDSYMSLFYLDFWEDIYSEWKKIDRESKNYNEEIDLFYHKYEDRFLNDYAATDPMEDIAESWEDFILKPAPSGDSISEQKVKFFYNFPELVQLRYQIIKGICTFKQTQ